VTHLDTSFLIDLLRETARGRTGPASALLEKLEKEDLAISVHVACELSAGAELADNTSVERRKVAALCAGLEVVIPDESFPALYGSLLAQLERRGERIGTMDLLIATAALAAEAPLVTRNERHFARVPGLRLIAYGK
jgi:tRNA(fMet)-specific endonuclease VapC